MTPAKSQHSHLHSHSDLTQKCIQYGGWLFFALVLLFLWQSWSKPNPHSTVQRQKQVDQQCQNTDPEDTIFVSIVCHYDPQLIRTLNHLFQSAFCPFRINVGVLFVDYPVPAWKAEGYITDSWTEETRELQPSWWSRVRKLVIQPSEYQSYGWARQQIEQQLYRGERYYLRITSHSMMVSHWDQHLIEHLKWCQTQSPRCILTSLSLGYSTIERDMFRIIPTEKQLGTYTCLQSFYPETLHTSFTAATFIREPQVPVVGLFYCDTFAFGPAFQMKEVSYEPLIRGWTENHGLDLYMSVRLWTMGYDFYHPPEQWVKTDWNAEWAQRQVHEEYDPNAQHLYEELLTLPPLTRGKRSLLEYQQFIGIDWSKKQYESLHALLGVPLHCTNGDILLRFTTLKEFEQIKAHVKQSLESK